MYQQTHLVKDSNKNPFRSYNNYFYFQIILEGFIIVMEIIFFPRIYYLFLRGFEIVKSYINLQSIHSIFFQR